MKFKMIHNRDLSPLKIVLDCEMAVLKTLKKFFLYSKLTLCRVHILRNLRKKGIEIFGKPCFEGNSDMKNFWDVIKGLFFVPPTSFEILKSFFISTFRPKFLNHKNDFDKFLSYLSKNYLNSTAKFPPSLWSYFTSLADFKDYTYNTNPIEGLNRVLKQKCPTGKISSYKACQIVHIVRPRVKFLNPVPQLAHSPTGTSPNWQFFCAIENLSPLRKKKVDQFFFN